MADSADTDEHRVYDPAAQHEFPDGRVNELLEFIENDEQIQTYLSAQNINPVTRKGYNDHGEKHIEIVLNRALSLYDLLKQGGVEFNGATDQGLDEADEPVIIALAATLHDIGHVVHRDNHSYYSIPIAGNILDRILSEFYDTADAVRVKGEVLHAILCHHTEETPLTTEAGVIRVSDGLDMERGRSRVPYERGGRGINTLSSQAITQVSIRPGETVPVLVEIEMTDAVGIYQVDELLKEKITDSLIEPYLQVVAVKKDGEEQLIDRYEL